MDRGKMNRKHQFAAGLFIILVGALIMFFIAGQRRESARQTPTATAYPVYPAADTMRRTVHLYFSGPDHSCLTAETRELNDPGNPAELGKSIVQALIDGPRETSGRTLPASTVVRDVYVTDNGTAYVDFEGGVVEDHPGGVQMEFISIYSVVNSLVLNLEEISAVKLLIGGRESETLVGHIDLRFPFKANILLIK
jgi:hypothetical protein